MVMRLPETEQPQYQLAFKRGYRLAMEGKAISAMPSDFRRDPQGRHYFEMGWQQANDAFAEQNKAQKVDWRGRAIWLGFAIMAGLLTANLMIQNIHHEQALKVPLKTEQSAPIAIQAEDLRLLNAESSQDLALNQAEVLQLQTLSNTPIIASEYGFVASRLFSSASGKDYAKDAVIPKFERKLDLTLQISAPDEQPLTLRWRYQNQQIHQEEFHTHKGLNTIQSLQLMTNGRQGAWSVEILNDQGTIYRYPFFFGSKP